MPIEEAVEQAITECIREGILKDFLEKNGREAIRVSIYEYDEERHIRQEREEAREEGERVGWEKGRLELIRKKLAKGKSIPEIAEALEEEEEMIRELIAQMQGKTD